MGLREREYRAEGRGGGLGKRMKEGEGGGRGGEKSENGRRKTVRRGF